MGQAQLLLLVLGVVLVGIAIIAGINAYDVNNRRASVDALTHEAITIASTLQVWSQTPEQLGGGRPKKPLPDQASSMAKATMAKVGHKKGEGSSETCALSNLTDMTATITCSNQVLGTEVVVDVTGFAHTDIKLTSAKYR